MLWAVGLRLSLWCWLVQEVGPSSQAKGDPVRLAMQAAAGAVAATIPCPLIMLCATQSSSAQVCSDAALQLEACS